MKNESVGPIPQCLVHVAVKRLDFPGFDAMLSRGHEGVDAFGALFSLQVHVTGHNDSTVAHIPHMNFQVLIPDSDAAASLERKYILHGRIHDWMNFKHWKRL